MLIINVWNKFHSKNFQKAPDIRKHVQNSLSVTICVKMKEIRSDQMTLKLPQGNEVDPEQHCSGVVQCPGLM